MNAKEAREKTQQVISSRLPTAISNVKHNINVAVENGYIFAYMYINPEFTNGVIDYLRENGYTVTEYGRSKWFSKDNYTHVVSW